MFLNSLLSTYAVEKFEPIAKWLTIGLLTALLLVGVLLFFGKREAFNAYLKYALIGTAVYLLVLAILFFSLDIAKNYSDSYAEENWLDKRLLIKYVLVPLLVLASVSLLTLLCYALADHFKPEAKKTVLIVGLALFTAALIAVAVCITTYYNQKIANDGYYNSDTASVKPLGLYLALAACICAYAVFFLIDKQAFSFDSRSLAYAGICVAMSFALSYIKLWEKEHVRHFASPARPLADSSRAIFHRLSRGVCRRGNCRALPLRTRLRKASAGEIHARRGACRYYAVCLPRAFGRARL